ncbi:MAG: hypothetical protein SV760_07915 [Halobacteria archaeon]|nr:hypothetical protein [Halobacteria archaeon]
MTSCSYCESEVERHDPIYVREADGNERAFCNYGCLSAEIEEEGLADGACCGIEFD